MLDAYTKLTKYFFNFYFLSQGSHGINNQLSFCPNTRMPLYIVPFKKQHNITSFLTISINSFFAVDRPHHMQHVETILLRTIDKFKFFVLHPLLQTSSFRVMHNISISYHSSTPTSQHNNKRSQHFFISCAPGIRQNITKVLYLNEMNKIRA